MPEAPSDAKPALDLTAMAILVVLCASWGFQQVTIKISNQAGSPILQAGIRSLVAGLLLWLWMAFRREPLLKKDGTLWWGLAVGAVFAGEFLLIYRGLDFTNASRAVIFFYTMPFFTALGAQLFIPGERLGRLQVAGLFCAFAGILAAFRESLAVSAHRMLVGDVMLTAAAVLWAAATVTIKACPLCRISPGKTLFYQLAVSAVLLPMGSLAFGEPGIAGVTPVIGACIAYQSVWVAFITYLAWFWLIRRYPASRIAAFAFLTPLFGVLSGVVLLGEPLTPSLLTALLLVGLGIYLVNRHGGGFRRRKRPGEG
jgi:drug/metabolite transporter (DMT)-like permease